jgi:hypothetical protein
MPSVLDDICHAPLKEIAEEAISRGEAVRLMVGAQGATRIETIVLAPSGRAAQTAGTVVFRGSWSGERLVTDASAHMLDVDGACFCRDCEMAGGHCVDDDE